MPRCQDISVIKDEIRRSSKETRIYVGCDSQVFFNDKIRSAVYVTAVVLHIDGNAGARIFWDHEIIRDYGSLRQRLMEEVRRTSDLALKISDVIEDRNFQIHIDINRDSKHKSNVVVQDAIGYVRSMIGIDPIIKSDHGDFPIAASSVADRIAVQHSRLMVM